MAHRDVVNFDLSLRVDGLDNIVASIQAGLGDIAEIREVVRKYTVLTQTTAVKNVSGGPVTYSGGTFVINRQTGKLARSIQSRYIGDLASITAASANYASDVESGTRGPTDMKPYLMGKTVPTRVKKGTPGAKEVKRRATTYRSAGSVFIIFRRVTANSKGWIIPQQAPRPFMQATAEYIEPLFRKDAEAVLTRYIEQSGLQGP